MSMADCTIAKSC